MQVVAIRLDRISSCIYYIQKILTNFVMVVGDVYLGLLFFLLSHMDGGCRGTEPYLTQADREEFYSPFFTVILQ